MDKMQKELGYWVRKEINSYGSMNMGRGNFGGDPSVL
jgi:hypothetical protein